METNGIVNSPFWMAWPPWSSGTAEGQENSLAGGRNCNRLYGSRAAQGKRCTAKHRNATVLRCRQRDIQETASERQAGILCEKCIDTVVRLTYYYVMRNTYHVITER